MASNATIHPMSIAPGDFQIPYLGFVLNGITIQGSVVASRYVHKRMLEFAALHKIAPITEKFPLTEKGLEEAMDKLANGSMRYRGVLIPQ
jgi:D-arabinose 1-dehydrogenase-like Zn-dependent alcohol dehydrogenase